MESRAGTLLNLAQISNLIRITFACRDDEPKDSTKGYQRHLITKEMTRGGPTATPLPLESRALLQV